MRKVSILCLGVALSSYRSILIKVLILIFLRSENFEEENNGKWDGQEVLLGTPIRKHYIKGLKQATLDTELHCS